MVQLDIMESEELAAVVVNRLLHTVVLLGAHHSSKNLVKNSLFGKTLPNFVSLL